MRTPDRLKSYLAAMEVQYPGCWDHYDRLRRDRGKDLPDWPAWCWCPLAGAYAIVSGGGDNRVPMDRGHHIGIMGALAPWRKTQGIYRYDAEMFASLWATPLGGAIPSEILYHLPEWCVYVEAPDGLHWDGKLLRGWFAHLEYDADDGRTELRLLCDTAAGLQPYPIHLGYANLEDCIRAALAEAAMNAYARGIDPHPIATADAASAAQGLAPLVSVLLYLCTEAADIRTRQGGLHPAHGGPRKPAHAKIDAPTVWEVGSRIGAALRDAYQREREERAAEGGSHAAPRPHIRRAHWHSFWTGPKSKPADRKISLRWLPPIPVSIDQGDVVPTVRRVR